MKQKFLRNIVVLLLTVISANIAAVSSAQSAEATARHYTNKPFIFDGERQRFYIDISNPTNSELRTVVATVNFAANVNVRASDRRCSQSRPNNQTQLTCTIPTLKARSFEQLSYTVEGDTDFRPGFEVTMAVSSADGSITVQSQDSDTEGLADGSRFVEGESFGIRVARDILWDSDGDGVSDVNEDLLGTDAGNPFSVSGRNAIIDVAVLQSRETDRHYGGRFGGRIEYLIAATNQFFRENKVGITLRLVALGVVDYNSQDSTLTEVSEDFFNRSNQAFSDLDSIIKNTGADVIVLAHPVFPATEDTPDFLCGVGQLNSGVIQGDFNRETNSAADMLIVLNSSRNCSSRQNLASLLALNMGVVTSRASNPDGGTFSFSSGFVQAGSFATLVPGSIIDEESAAADPGVTVNLLSSPERLCLGRPCGIDRNDLVRGADAVFSLNATRYVIEDLSPVVMPISNADVEPKVTISASNKNLIDVRQIADASSVIRGERVNVQVEATNTSDEIVHHLEFRFIGSARSAIYSTDDNQCSILVEGAGDPVRDSFGAYEGMGSISCYVRSLAPGQTAGFRYTTQIDSPEDYLGQDVYLLSAAVNNHLMADAHACVLVSENASEQFTALNVCPSLVSDANSFADPARAFDSINLSLVPEARGNILTVPFIRLFDGGLVSAQFKTIQGTANSFELIDLNVLDPTLRPSFAAAFGANELLSLKNLTIDGLAGYTMTLRLVDGSAPPQFEQIELARF